ncbi:hypothetical protein UlMin_032022 [Ulmus minor]
MVVLKLAWRLPNPHPYRPASSSLLQNPFCYKSTKTLRPWERNIVSSSSHTKTSSFIQIRVVLRPLCALPETQKSQSFIEEEEEEGIASGSGNSKIILSSCLVGLLTGIGVVLFNYGVHEIRDLFWDGIPYRGASFLREEPIQENLKRVILVPACGGLIVGVLNVLRSALDDDPENGGSIVVGSRMPVSIFESIKVASRPFLKAVAACVTLGTGNSLGPEGPSVEIGSSIGKGVGALLDRSSNTNISLLAAGSAAGIASGFNAAVAGCFFAVESVLWPSATDPSEEALTNNTSVVILSAVIASVVSEVCLGSEPAFKVPEYDFRSPTELPLYLLLGTLCGLVSLALSKCTTYMLRVVDNLHEATGVSKALFPLLGGLTVGLIALAYPEILFWGFENVDILLESRPFVKGLSADLLLQLVAVKILATSLCRASGLVGGYYAPSLFIGAAAGMAYGKIIGFAVGQPDPMIDLSFLEVASPQAYGLVGMAATLAGVCQVPLTAVLLLFELTQDYRIVLPLLGAVGLSSWVTSGQTIRRDMQEKKKLKQERTREIQQPNMLPSGSSRQSSNTSDLCEIESSLCVDDSNFETNNLEKETYVSQAMRTRYVAVMMNTLLTDTLTLMLKEKQPCAMIVDKDNILIGFLTLKEIQEFSKNEKTRSKISKELLVSEMCSYGEICRVPWVATPSMDLLSVQMIMNRRGMDEVPVVTEQFEDRGGHLVGLLDKECINLTCRALATRVPFLR